MAHRLAPTAEVDLDDIWYYVAGESGNPEIADRIIDKITDTFWMLAQFPHVGRRRDRDLSPGLRSFPVGEYVIFYRVEGRDVLVLHVMRGSRDLEVWFRD